MCEVREIGVLGDGDSKYREQTSGYQWGEGNREEQDRNRVSSFSHLDVLFPRELPL